MVRFLVLHLRHRETIVLEMPCITVSDQPRKVLRPEQEGLRPKTKSPYLEWLDLAYEATVVSMMLEERWFAHIVCVLYAGKHNKMSQQKVNRVIFIKHLGKRRDKGKWVA